MSFMHHKFTPKQIEDMRQICEHTFGQTFTQEEAEVMAHRLNDLYEELKKQA
jgi:glutathione peroxidase-family protein